MAAAMAANIMEFVRWNFPPKEAEPFANFGSYGTMRQLFLKHMTVNGTLRGDYHYLMPWREGLWDDQTSVEEVVRRLKDISIGIERPVYVI